MWVSSDGSGESAHMCADSPELSLVANARSTNIPRADTYVLWKQDIQDRWSVCFFFIQVKASQLMRKYIERIQGFTMESSQPLDLTICTLLICFLWISHMGQILCKDSDQTIVCSYGHCFWTISRSANDQLKDHWTRIFILNWQQF